MEHLNEYRHRHTLGMTLDTVREVAIGVPTKGLDYLHEHGVAHMDIKPENIVIFQKHSY